MAPPRTVVTTSSCSLLLIYRCRKDERLGWPGWLTYSGRFTHISGHPSAVGQVQDSESLPVKKQRSTAEPRNQPRFHKGWWLGYTVSVSIKDVRRSTISWRVCVKLLVNEMWHSTTTVAQNYRAKDHVQSYDASTTACVDLPALQMQHAECTVKSAASTWQHRFDSYSNFLSDPAPLSLVKFCRKCNQFICWWLWLPHTNFIKIDSVCIYLHKATNADVGKRDRDNGTDWKQHPPRPTDWQRHKQLHN